MPDSNIIMYTIEDGLIKIETTFENDTVWLSIDQMAEVFQRDKSVIGKHVRNIFKEGELVKESVWAKLPILLLMVKCTGQHISILQRRSYIKEQMLRKKIWD